MNQPHFYTTGCANQSITDLPAIAQRYEAHVADIRLTVDANSADLPAELQPLLGLRYRRVAHIGGGGAPAQRGDQPHFARGEQRLMTGE